MKHRMSEVFWVEPHKNAGAASLSPVRGLCQTDPYLGLKIIVCGSTYQVDSDVTSEKLFNSLFSRGYVYIPVIITNLRRICPLDGTERYSVSDQNGVREISVSEYNTILTKEKQTLNSICIPNYEHINGHQVINHMFVHKKYGK